MAKITFLTLDTSCADALLQFASSARKSWFRDMHGNGEPFDCEEISFAVQGAIELGHDATKLRELERELIAGLTEAAHETS